MRTTAASAGRLAQPDLPARQGRAVFAANAVRWDRAAQRARPVPPDLPAVRLARPDPPDLAEQLVLAVPQAQPARVEQQAQRALAAQLGRPAQRALPVPLVPAV